MGTPNFVAKSNRSVSTSGTDYFNWCLGGGSLVGWSPSPVGSALIPGS